MSSKVTRAARARTLAYWALQGLKTTGTIEDLEAAKAALHRADARWRSALAEAVAEKAKVSL